MAVRHVREYYKLMEQQYLDMLQNVKDFDELLKQGVVPEEVMQQAKSMLDAMKSNYDRLSYIMLLLNQPNRNKKEKNYKKSISNELDFLVSNNATQGSVFVENEDLLKNFKKLIKGVKDEGNSK